MVPVLLLSFLISSALGQTIDCTGKQPAPLTGESWISSPLCKDPRASANGGKWFDKDGGATRCSCWSFCGYKCFPHPLFVSTTTTPSTTTKAAPVACSSGNWFVTDTIICFCVKGTPYYDCYPFP